MSLTRAQWKEMWSSIRKIEREVIATHKPTSVSLKYILPEIEKIKEQIESVVGQLR